MVRWMAFSAVWSLVRVAGSMAAAGGTGEGPEMGPSRVTGQAFYRERIVLPPGAIFKAVLQDTARAGAPATTIGRTIRHAMALRRRVVTA